MNTFDNKSITASKIIKLIFALILMAVVIFEPLEGIVRLEPILDLFVPDYLDNPDSSSGKTNVYLLKGFSYFMILLFGIAFILMVLAFFSLIFNFYSKKVVTLFSLCVSSIEFIGKPFILFMDRLLVSLSLAIVIMFVLLLPLGILRDTIEQNSAIVLASMLVVSTFATKGKPILKPFR